MIDFQRLELQDKAKYITYLHGCSDRGCEYSFVNLFLWGRQKAAFIENNLVFLSQFDRRSVYPFPIGTGDPKNALDALIADAKSRGIPCCLTSLVKADCDLLENLYPGAFQFHTDRDSFDYIYSIDDLADLTGRKYQKKRNHYNRFLAEHPDFQVLPLDSSTQSAAMEMLEQWYRDKREADPHNDFHLEQLAIQRAFAFREQLDLEGLVLVENGTVLAFCMGSALNADTFDIHFEKARGSEDGAYAVINREFAKHLRQKYPALRWLNREDDMGLEGLRKAKLSYNPDHMIEKYWARLWEDEDEH